MYSLINGKKIPHSALTVASLIRILNGKATYDKLVACGGLGRSTISNAIKALESAGLLVVDRRSHAHTYTLSAMEMLPNTYSIDEVTLLSAKKIKRKKQFRRPTLTTRWCQLKNGAKQRSRDIPVTLTKEDYEKIVGGGICSYCGGKLSKTGHGLDRVDNKKGYEVGNVTPCCSGCNRLKCHLLTANETKMIVTLLKFSRQTDNIWNYPL